MRRKTAADQTAIACASVTVRCIPVPTHVVRDQQRSGHSPYLSKSTVLVSLTMPGKYVKAGHVQQFNVATLKL